MRKTIANAAITAPDSGKAIRSCGSFIEFGVAVGIGVGAVVGGFSVYHETVTSELQAVRAETAASVQASMPA